MPDWREQTRVSVADGHTTARDVAEWFVCEWFGPRVPWDWDDRAAGEFRCRGDLYRVRAAGIEGGYWVVEWAMRENHA